MTLFKKAQVSVKDAALSAENAQTIYGHFKDGLSESDCFSKHGFNMTDVMSVMKEARLLEASVNSQMASGVVTKKGLNISSDLLDVSVLIDDVIAFSDGNPDEAKTFATFKSSFDNNAI